MPQLPIQTEFFNTLKEYTHAESHIYTLWHKIEIQYSNFERHYHNLTHLENMYKCLVSVKDKIQHWDCIILALAYHDILYDVRKNTNEEDSAHFALSQLKTLVLPEYKLQRISNLILATKHHAYNEDSDTNYFIDADLSILGSSESAYKMYAENIRKEYVVYPDELYNAGRRKVLEGFLNKAKIYFTTEFHSLYNNQARMNIQNEIKSL
jgi:predicted metal-dependent HD superfamily phosphohydrolase